jgi:hypothetical protein
MEYTRVHFLYFLGAQSVWIFFFFLMGQSNKEAHHGKAKFELWVSPHK